MASSICSVMLPLVAAKSPEPLPLQKQQPLAKRAIAVWAGGSTSQRNFIYFLKTFFVLVIQRVVRFIAPFFHD